VEACGICHTDLKKIEHNLLAPPRVYGHETAGVVAAAGAGVAKYRPGDRVVAFHHIPCLECFYCRRKIYAQCPVYKKVGITAGFEPAGGGFAQYVRVMDWIVERGVEKIPDGVSFERATLVEPLNTCLKAVVQCDPQPEDFVVVLGQGPIGLMFTMLVKRRARASRPPIPSASDCGWRPVRRGIHLGPRTGGCRLGGQAPHRGARRGPGDRGGSAPGIVDQAMACSRPGSRILLFAQTSATERIEASGADICVGERSLFGCYSASVDLQAESANLVFGGELPVEELISHRLPLVKIRSGIDLALHPGPKSLKIIVQPQRWS
jgi:L-iditol 2-dehydrogenase